MFKKMIRATGLLLLLTTVLNCSDDDPSGPGADDADGVARFRYDGSGFSGNFDATGRFERDGFGVMKRQSFATGVDVTLPQQQLAYYGIVAAHFYPPDLDDLSILLSGQGEGDYPIIPSDECSLMIDEGSGRCSSVIFDFELSSNGGFSPKTTSFELVSGMVSVTSISEGRIKGTFNGTARQFGAWGAEELYVPDIEVKISGGAFDVPIVSLAYWNGLSATPGLFAPMTPLLRY